VIADITKRLGVVDAVPNALARMRGAMTLARHTLERTPAPVAPTPAALVHQEGAARLLRYMEAPGGATKPAVLLSPSLINRLYVLDLKTGISVVEALVNAGHRVYGIDWGEPGEAEKGVPFDGFVDRLSRFLDKACADNRTEKIHVLGHCLGGTMTTALAAVDDKRFASLINLTAPLSFHDGGMLSAWTRAPFFDPSAIVKVTGHVPAWLTQPAFQILKPAGQPAKALRLFQNMGDEKFLEFFRCLETWINDNVSIPDGFFVDLVGKLYREDALVNGLLTVSGKSVKLENVKVPVLTVAAAEDHIVPVASATEPVSRFSSSVKRTETLPGGHIGVVVGGLARRRLWPLLIEWMSNPEASIQ
jgi:polyhydroxyalkanoate synthase subunit PhaC